MKKRTRARGTTLVTFPRNMAPLPRDDGEPLPPPAVDEVPGATHAVYYITTRFMRVLYIGQTSHLIVRLRTHAKNEWFTQDCRIFAEWFRDRAAALERETHAIWDVRPEHNRRFIKPTGTAPEPDLAIRQLVDLDRDIPSLCTNCGRGWQSVRQLCYACNSYLHRHGSHRPSHVYDR